MTGAASVVAVVAVGVLIGLLAAGWFGWAAVVVLACLLVVVVATVSARP